MRKNKLLALLIPVLFVLVTLGFAKVASDISLTTQMRVPLAARKAPAATDRRQPAIGNTSHAQYLAANQNAAGLVAKQAVGALKIPEVNIDLPILSPITNQTLSVGAAEYFADRQPGAGNYVLASHNFNGARVLMANIAGLKTGAAISVVTKDQTYTYRVVANAVIHESEVSVLANSAKPLLTLIRCEGGFNTPYRRVVQAELIKQQATTTKTVAVADTNLKTTGGYHSAVAKLAGHQTTKQLSMTVAKALANQTLFIVIVGLWLIAVVGVTWGSFKLV